jgi:predicted metal-dependent HD superfamily phosphohydrolase
MVYLQILKYHTKGHTEDVFRDSITFGILDNLGDYELQRIAIAAAWHDVGYLVRKKDNEEVAVEMFENDEITKSLDPKLVQEIKNMIMDTKVVIGQNGPEIILHSEYSA